MNTSVWLSGWETRALAQERTLAQETLLLRVKIRALEEKIRALEEEILALEEENRVLDNFRFNNLYDVKDALKWADCVLEGGRVKPTDIKQHLEQLLKLMDNGFWLKHSIPSSHNKILKAMLEEIPKLIGMHQRLGLRYHSLEAQLSLDKILRLSSWTPSSTHNNRLRELLRDALLILNDVGGSEEYHDNLRDLMKQHTAFCAFTLDNANVINMEDSETTADLCKNLRRLAQNLGKIASTKAEQYQQLYENFIAHKEGLSHWLDEASPGQGKLYF